MDKFKELSFEEKMEIDGGGPISDWICKKIKEFLDKPVPQVPPADMCAECVFV
ncbi:MAG: hypothetical protein ACXIUD_02085 [Mongoliitalea sp.]